MSLEKTLTTIQDLYVQHFMANDEASQNIISEQILDAEKKVPREI